MANKESNHARLTMIAHSAGRFREPWFLATGCSWRRILQEHTDEPVIMPTNHPRDGHLDLAGGENVLQRACQAVNACAGVDAPLPFGIVKAMAEALEKADQALTNSADAAQADAARHVQEVLAAYRTGDLSAIAASCRASEGA